MPETVLDKPTATPPTVTVTPPAPADPTVEETPKWMKQLARRAEKLGQAAAENEMLAFSKAATVWNEFLTELSFINGEHGTNYTPEQVWMFFQGKEAPPELEIQSEEDED